MKKYKNFGPEGYGFIVIHNGEKEASFKENVVYNTFKGLTFMAPETGQGYDVTVGPGETRTIVLKCDPEGYGMSSSSSTQIIHGEGKLQQMCIDEGKRADRPDPENGKAYAIYQYTLKHGGGIAYLYVNETPDKTLEETMEFTLQGLEIEGKPGEKEVEVVVGPGEKKMVKLVAIGGQWKVSMAVGYGIE